MRSAAPLGTKEWQHLLRYDEWAYSVAPLVLAAPLYYLCTQPPDVIRAQETFVGLAGFAVFLFMLLGFGYAVNDYSDIEVDKAAGKDKLISRLPRQKSVSILATLVVVGVLATALAPHHKLVSMLVAVGAYILGAAYSLPFFRAKERGVLGPIVSSFAQRGTPVIVAGVMFSMDSQFTAAWVLLSFLNGLRYIFIHQLLDEENDRVGNVRTFVTDNGAKVTRRLIVVVFVVELVLLIPVMAPSLAHSANVWVYALFGGYAALGITVTLIYVRVFGKSDLLFTYDLVPFEVFLNYVLPAAALILLTEQDYYYLLILILFSICMFPMIRSKLYALRGFMDLVRGRHVQLPLED